MEEHFGSEFGLSKEAVVEIIQGFNWTSSRVPGDTFCTTHEKTKYALLKKYVNLPMSEEFMDVLRKAYRKVSKEECEEQYLDALKKLLFPEDYAEQPASVEPALRVDRTTDPLYIGLVAALYCGTKYTKEEICTLLGLTDDEYWIMRQNPRVAH